MAQDFVTRLTNDATQFNQSFDEATGKVEKFTDTTKKADESIKDLGSEGVRSTRDLLKEISKLSGAERSVSNYRRQLSQMTRDIQDLTINYNKLSEADKNSEIGRATLARIQELTSKAGQYRDAVLDAQAAVNAMASDTANWDAAKQGIDMLSGALQGIVSAGVLGKESTEDLVRVIANLRAVEAATNAVIKIGNALQKQSALMMGISRVQAAALARAKDLEAAATGRATIAQKAFNIIAKANPYVLLAAAVLAVGTALFAFTKKSKEAAEAEKKQKEETEKLNEELDNYAKTVGGAAGKAGYEFDKLKRSYEKLSSSDKTKWIKDNQKAFNDLGISIKNINDADNVFISNANAFQNAVMQRARAAAMFTLIEQNWTKYGEEIDKLSKQEKPYKAGQIFSNDRLSNITGRRPMELGTGGRQMGQDYTSLSQEGADILNEEWLEKRRQEAYAKLLESNKIFQQEMDDANAKFDEILKQYGIKPSGGNDTKTTIEYEIQVGSLTEAQNKVNELQKQLNSLAPNDPNFDTVKKDLEDWTKKANNLKKNYTIDKQISETDDKLSKLVHGSLEEANYFVSAFSKELSELDPATDEFKEVLDLLNAWKKRQAEINSLINGTKEEVKTIVDEYNELKKQADDIQMQMEIGAIDPVEAQRAINELNNKLKDKGLTVNFDLEFNLNENKLGDKIDNIKDLFDDLSDVFYSPINAIDNIVSSFEHLNDTLEDPDASGWEKFFAVFQVGETILSTVSTVLGVVRTVTDLLTQSKNKNAQASIQEAAAEQAGIAVKGESTVAAFTEAGAEGAAAGAKGAKSVSGIPYIGPILAVAAIASIMAAIVGMISMAKGFSTGGVVGGHSYTGDKIFTRLNSGELILNAKQQDTLWKDLNRENTINANYTNSINIPDKITLIAHGGDLVGVIDNTRRKISKI